MLIDTLSSGIPKIPDFNLSSKVFLIKTTTDTSEKLKLINEVEKQIKSDNMAPYYEYLVKTIKLDGLKWDQLLFDEMTLKNTTDIKELKDKIEELKEDDEGESEIVNWWIKISDYYAKIGDAKNSVKILKDVLDSAPSTGSKIDLYLTISRIGFFLDDKLFTKEYLDKANSLIEKGGDWERRNRYKTYLGIYLMSTRKFKEASKLLIDSLATFTSTEIATYEDVAQYALICGAISLDRSDLKKKLIESPEILSINSNTNELLPIFNLIKSLYFSEYNKFFPYLLETHDLILTRNKYLSPHTHYYLREMRSKAYSQLLESYKSLSLKSMADQFGISIEFLDDDFCKFIPTKKLNCVIDRVNGIVETNRPDNKNSQYHLLIKNGDALLTKLQKYGAAVKLSGAENV
ncbi:hypothetical protein B5S31_g3148 [[Candida] boidinii]|nr:hypothetical protein B5S31_g3148 [[Candida] boidinii]